MGAEGANLSAWQRMAVDAAVFNQVINRHDVRLALIDAAEVPEPAAIDPAQASLSFKPLVTADRLHIALSAMHVPNGIVWN